MNNDKTKVIWIGGKKRYQAQFLRDMNFCWDTSIYLAFRIKISANIDHINVINYETKVGVIKTILKPGRKNNSLHLEK